MGNLTKLTTCISDFEAQIIKGALKAEGIVCMLSNENITNLYNGVISEFTGIDVLVATEDMEKAIEICNRSKTSIPAEELENIEIAENNFG